MDRYQEITPESCLEPRFGAILSLAARLRVRYAQSIGPTTSEKEVSGLGSGSRRWTLPSSHESKDCVR